MHDMTITFIRSPGFTYIWAKITKRNNGVPQPRGKTNERPTHFAKQVIVIVFWYKKRDIFLFYIPIIPIVTRTRAKQKQGYVAKWQYQTSKQSAGLDNLASSILQSWLDTLNCIYFRPIEGALKRQTAVVQR